MTTDWVAVTVNDDSCLQGIILNQVLGMCASTFASKPKRVCAPPATAAAPVCGQVKESTWLDAVCCALNNSHSGVEDSMLLNFLSEF